jgi:hypothetical protein
LDQFLCMAFAQMTFRESPGAMSRSFEIGGAALLALSL